MIDGLDFQIKKPRVRVSTLTTPMPARTWLKQTFMEADKNGDGTLSISEVLQLLHKLNVNLTRQKVKKMFKVTAVHGLGQK